MGVDLNLLQQQMLSKGFIKQQQKADIIQQQTILSNLSDGTMEISSLADKSLSTDFNA